MHALRNPLAQIIFALGALAFILGFSLLMGCGCSSLRISQSETDTNGVERVTSFRATTFFDSKSSLAKARTTMTDKSQGVAIADLSQESSGSNAVALTETVVRAAVTAAVKSVAP